MSTLPTKWAVEIQSLQDAERLQALFPGDAMDILSVYQSSFNKQGNPLYDKIALAKGASFVNYWGYSPPDFYSEDLGYTILSITELENLLK